MDAEKQLENMEISLHDMFYDYKNLKKELLLIIEENEQLQAERDSLIEQCNNLQATILDMTEGVA